jgi:hypothetical protein
MNPCVSQFYMYRTWKARHSSIVSRMDRRKFDWIRKELGLFKVELVGQLGISHQSLSTGASAMERRDLLPWQSSRFGTRTAWGIVGRTGRTGKRDDTKSKRQPGKLRRQKRIFCCKRTIRYILRSRIYRAFLNNPS